VLRDAKQLEGGEAMVECHTDRVGDPALNDALSLSRAKVIRDLLLGAGILPDLVTAVGRGEHEPVVPTEPGVAEAQNRRVEILVR
jgi:outer membrane protein OmpA-like peptidoglycan-associated protein